MATFYLDFINGNDASAGTSWATAWKTINDGATAARIAPGDEIRIAKTADPTSIGNATWTNQSATVTLASAQTTNLYLDGSWTAANSGAATTTTTRKEGATASQITTAATTATSTKYAYYATGTLDLSSYDSITLWIQNRSVALSANNYQIKLCSDTTGDTAVDTFDIPAIASNNVWVPLTLTRVGGGALGNSIKSIGFYTGTVNPGNSRINFLDNILASDIDGLNLTSLISKNSAGHTSFASSDTWHGLQSINGTTVTLANLNSDIVGGNLWGYWTSGTSPQTVTTYIRPTYKFAMQTGASAAQPVQDSGTAGNLITFSGGWNTSNTTQDGETWIDGQNGTGNALDISSSRNYIKFERIGACRFVNGLFMATGNNTGVIVSNCHFINNTNAMNSNHISGDVTAIANNNNTGLNSTTGTGTNNKWNLKIFNNNQSTGIPGTSKITNIYYGNNVGNLTLTTSFIDYFDYSNNYGQLSLSNTGLVTIKEAIIKSNTSVSGPITGGGSTLIINKLTASGNTAVGTTNGFIYVKQTNAASTQLLGSGTPSSSQTFSTPAINFNAVNNTTTDNRSYWQFGNALSQTTTRHTASGIAWQINITNTAQTSNFPIYYPIAKVACNANSLVTVKAWVKLSHATDIGAKLMIQANEIAGVSADVTATKTADTNWEELQITFTPTTVGVAQIYLQGYWLANTADESIYVDDITVTQA